MAAPNVLVVEDEPDIAEVLVLLLGACGHAVVVAGDLAAAREHLVSAPLPGLVILDRLLPDGDGLELCREVKRRRPSLPVLVVTAESGAEPSAAAAGADLCLVKPFDPDLLERYVDRFLALAEGGPDGGAVTGAA